MLTTTNDFHIQVDKDRLTSTHIMIDENAELAKTSESEDTKFDVKEYVRLINPIEGESLDEKNNDSYELQHKELGNFLFKFLFPQTIEDHFRKSYDRLPPGEKLRIRLFVNDPSISNVAWEFAYDEKLDRYLCTFPKTPFTRFPSDASTLFNMAKQQQQRIGSRQKQTSARLLFVAANACGDAQIKTQKEIENIILNLNTVSSQSRIQIRHKNGIEPTWNGVFQELTEGVRAFQGYNILHFYGHGEFESGEAKLVFEGKNGEADPILPNRFSQLLDLPLSQNLKLVFLNACSGAKATEQKTNSGLALGLFSKGISNVLSVIAMQFTITISAAAFVAQNLYFELSKGAPIDDAVQTTRAILLNTNPYKGKRLFATPVIFMNARNGYVFGLPDFSKELSETKETKVGGGTHQPLSTYIETEPKIKLLSKAYQVIDRMIQVIGIAITLKGKSSKEISEFAKTISPTITNFVSTYMALVASMKNDFQNFADMINKEAKPISNLISELNDPFEENSDIDDVGEYLQKRLSRIVSSYEDFWKFMVKMTIESRGGNV